jgi:hypothetical protein
MAYTINIQPIVINARDKKYLEQIKNRDYNNCATLEEATRMLVIDLLKERCDDEFAQNVIKRIQDKHKNEEKKLNLKELRTDLHNRKLLSTFMKGFLSEIDEQQKNKNSDSEESKPGATE